MERRDFIKTGLGFGLACHSWKEVSRVLPAGAMRGAGAGPFAGSIEEGGAGSLTGPGQPVFVYNNWSAYDELSDKVVQTEELAMRELEEMLRLKRAGVRFDYYVMDAFWFDKWGGYRSWHREHWPAGPDKWLAACREHGIRPGMWFSTNLIATHEGRFLEPVAEWQDSVATDPNILCLFEGGYLEHLAGSLQHWYDRGVRLFKFDFAYFEAVTAVSRDKFTPEEVKEKNKTAFMGMLKRFRERNPDVLITGYNGFGGEMENTFQPFRKTVDDRWLEVFDTLYCGDPRFSDVPMLNIWRSQDNYSDHMVRQFAFNGLSLRRIDNCAFMIGKTGTCYYRAMQAWKGMLLLELARGGWMNVYHGNLELMSDENARWFARVQRIYEPIQRRDGMLVFGAVPGEGKPYGFAARGLKGMVYTVVNPSQEVAELGLPGPEGAAEEYNGAGLSSGAKKDKVRVLYADSGFVPEVRGGKVRLGSEQLAVVGTGEYAGDEYVLGTDDTIRIPVFQQRLDVKFAGRGRNRIGAGVSGVAGKGIRVLFQQFGADGYPRRSWGGAPPDGKPMNALLSIRVRQGEKELPLRVGNDKMIWSGMSWAAAELEAGAFDAGLPLNIECQSAEPDELRLEARVYVVSY